MIVRSEKTPLGLSQADNVPQAVESPSKKVAPVEKKEVTQAESDHYKVGDNIDCRDAETGAWFEAVIERITANDDVRGLDSLTYHVKVIYFYYSTRSFIFSFSLRDMKMRMPNRKCLCSSSGPEPRS